MHKQPTPKVTSAEGVFPVTVDLADLEAQCNRDGIKVRDFWLGWLEGWADVVLFRSVVSFNSLDLFITSLVESSSDNAS